MRHQVAIFLGDELCALANGVMKHVLKYGHETVVPCFNTLLCERGKEGGFDIKKYQKISPKKGFESDMESEYQVVASDVKTISKDGQLIELADFLKTLHSETVTISNVEDYGSNKLLLTIYVPMFLESLTELAEAILKSVSGVMNKFDIDVVALSPDVVRKLKDSPFFVNRMESCKDAFKEGVRKFASYAKDRMVNQIAVLDNKNRQGVSLNLNTDMLVRTIGEYSLLTTEKYGDVYNPTTVLETVGQVATFGLSSLYFDKYYFVNYVLRKAYIDLIDKEKVSENGGGDCDWDVNWAAKKAKDLICKHVGMVDKFWHEKVNPLLVQEKEQEDIVNDIRSDLNEMYKTLEGELMSVLTDGEMSLPQKKAVLAEITANDDESLDGNLLMEETFSMDDLDVEPASFFIAESEALEEGHKLRMERLPVNEIKNLKNEIRQSTAYLRKKTEELNLLGKQIDNVEQSKKIVDGAFSYDGVQYKLLGNDVKEQPLDETYDAHETKEESVDLSDYFTAVKNQGGLGACTVFSLVSIYEYILKKNDGVDYDLSEMFVYYNARRQEGKENEACGTSFYHAIKALQNDGLCTDALCMYNENRYSDIPSDDAYEDGKKRQVLVAKNLPVNIDAIRSALADGYPIAMSFKIYDSFDAPKGFVQTPTDAEMQTEGERHAMVVVGYSDEHKMLKVRNSWGKNFGDSGYCYVPYSWVTSLNLACDACIITQISQEVKVAGVVKHESVDFDLADATIKSFILKNMIGEERVKLDRFKREYADKRHDYETIIQTLGNHGNRKQIVEASVNKRVEALDAYRMKKDDREKELREEIRAYEEGTNSILLKAGAFILMLVAVLGLIWYYFIKFELDIFFDEYALVKSSAVVAGVAALVGVIVFYFIRRHRNMRQKAMEEEMKDEISSMAKKAQRMQREINERKLMGNVYGTALDKLIGIQTKLTEKYRTTVSFVDNLRRWKEDEKARQVEMKSETNGAFIPMLENGVLDEYSEKCLPKITKDIYLYKYLASDFKLDDEALLRFKKDIKDEIVRKLMEECAGFNAVSSVLGMDFGYVDAKAMKDMMPTMLKYSEPFFESSDLKNEKQPTTSTIYIGTKDKADLSNWNNEYRKYFSLCPTTCVRESCDSIVLMQQRFVGVDSLVV